MKEKYNILRKSKSESEFAINLILCGFDTKKECTIQDMIDLFRYGLDIDDRKRTNKNVIGLVTLLNIQSENHIFDSAMNTKMFWNFFGRWIRHNYMCKDKTNFILISKFIGMASNIYVNNNKE